MRGNLLRHKRIKHGENNKVKRQACKVSCCICDKIFISMLQLRHHLVNEHDIGAALEQEHQFFNSVQEFHEWKKSMEKATSACFVVANGASKNKDGYSQVFYCNRSGPAKCVADAERQRAPRAQGSRKMGFYCTAAIHIWVKQCGEISVAFYKHHFGHGDGVADLIHLPLAKADKQLIAGKLMQGVSLERVLDDISDLSTAKRRVTELLSEIAAQIAECSSLDAVNAAIVELSKVKAIFDEASSQSVVRETVPESGPFRKPANKKATKQVRFFSRKRPKPTTPEDVRAPSKAARTIFIAVSSRAATRKYPL